VTHEAMFGTLNLTSDLQRVSIQYLETGIVPPEITIMVSGAQLRIAAEIGPEQ
jgi:hypothetical protein